MLREGRGVSNELGNNDGDEPRSNEGAAQVPRVLRRQRSPALLWNLGFIVQGLALGFRA